VKGEKVSQGSTEVPTYIHARRYFPAFNTIHEGPPDEATVSTVEELLAVPWIAQWVRSSEDRVVTRQVFYPKTGLTIPETVWVPGQTWHRWSIADRERDPCLMAEVDGGNLFHVVAFLTSDGYIVLPDWIERTPKWREAPKPVMIPGQP
jgi:hypothetical protein